MDRLQENGIGIGVDWLRFKCTVNVSRETIALVGGNIGAWSSRGILGKMYSCRLEGINGVTIASDTVFESVGRPSNSEVVVDISAVGLAEMADRGVSVADIILSNMSDELFTVTRVDMAIDVSDGWAVERAIDHLDGGYEVKTRWRTYDVYGSRDVTSREKMGMTLAMGSRTSGNYLRIYDKRAEMLARAEQCEVDMLTRVEIECKRRVAHDVAVAGAVEGFDQSFIGGYIRSKVDFIASNGTTTEWWFHTVCGSAPYRVPNKKPESTRERRRNWMLRNVAKSLAAEIIADGGDLGFVEELVHEGASRLSPAERRDAESYNDSLN